MGSLIERLRWVRREALGLNRRNQELVLRFNQPRLVALVDHKVQTKEVLFRHGLPVPQTYGRYERQRQLGDLMEEAERHRDFVLKPARGAGGNGVLVIVGRVGERLQRASGATLTRADFLAHAADIIAGAFSLSQTRDEALLEYRLTPEPMLAEYSPGGIPDVRIVVCHGVPIMAMLRLPTVASEGRANLHVGGIGVGIDLATGRGVHAIWRDRSIRVHPDTQRPLSALQVPHWKEILQISARSYEAIPLGYCGIDIVVDENLGPVILEMNARPGLSIQLANQCGLRRTLETLAREAKPPSSLEERLAFGLRLAAEREKRTRSDGGNRV